MSEFYDYGYEEAGSWPLHRQAEQNYAAHFEEKRENNFNERVTEHGSLLSAECSRPERNWGERMKGSTSP